MRENCAVLNFPAERRRDIPIVDEFAEDFAQVETGLDDIDDIEDIGDIRLDDAGDNMLDNVAFS